MKIHISPINIERASYLPSKETNRDLAMKLKFFKKHNYKPSFQGHEYVYKIIKRILHNNIGKSFSMAFHYYCTKVDKKHQNDFFNYFQSNNELFYGKDDFYVDNDGIIRKHKPTRVRRFFITGKDYRVYWERVYKTKTEKTYTCPDYWVSRGYVKKYEGTKTYVNRRSLEWRRYRNNVVKLRRQERKQRRANNKKRSIEIYNNALIYYKQIQEIIKLNKERLLLNEELEKVPTVFELIRKQKIINSL